MHTDEDDEGIIDDICTDLKRMTTKYSALARALRINRSDMDALNDQCANSLNKAQDLLVGVIRLYITQKYNPDYGEPTWKGIVYAVNRENPALARHLAEKHQGMCTCEWLFTL